VNTVAASFNAIMGQMTKISQRKKIPSLQPCVALQNSLR